jgi:hypothetical protein
MVDGCIGGSEHVLGFFVVNDCGTHVHTLVHAWWLQAFYLIQAYWRGQEVQRQWALKNQCVRSHS